MSSSMQGEHSKDSMGDIQDDQSLVMVQPEQHMVEHGAVEEDVMHIMHENPLGESQMEAHSEPVLDMWLPLGSAMEEDLVHPSLGRPIDEVSVDACTISRTAKILGTNTL